MPELILGVSIGFVPIVFIALVFVRLVQLVGQQRK